MKHIALFLCTGIIVLAANVTKMTPGEPTITAPVLNVLFSSGTPQTLSGQVFVRTKGGETFKMSGIEVMAYPFAVLAEYKAWMKSQGAKRVRYYQQRFMNLLNADELDRAELEGMLLSAAKRDNWLYLPKSPVATKTDADGKFTLNIPNQESFFVLAVCSRTVGKKNEYYVWAVPSEEAVGGQLLLSNDNLVEL